MRSLGFRRESEVDTLLTTRGFLRVEFEYNKMLNLIYQTNIL